MALGFCVGDLEWEVGSSGFLNAFFSTISYHLEPGGRGTRFPVLMRHLYHGSLTPDLVDQTRRELDDARRELHAFPPEAVVWDLEDPSARPPWGSDISAHIKDLSNYFVTSDGRDLIDVLQEVLDASQRSGQALTIG